MRVKESERARKIELARLEIRRDGEKQEAGRKNDSVWMTKAEREYANGVQLADRTYEIDVAQLGKVWTWIGRLLSRIL